MKRQRRKSDHRKQRQINEEKEILLLSKRVKDEAPPLGTNPLYADEDVTEDPIAKRRAQRNSQSGPRIVYSAIRKFTELPLSKRTQQALAEAKFTHMTDIQRAAISHALAGRDILGAARTGSGKTLAFLIPMLEKLHRERWGPLDGIGALIISPTRELAIQIFDVLRKVGKHHSFSAGLVIGGKDVEEEQMLITQMNIVISTPGRLLQHMDETYGFECRQLKMLILDEADRILDLGFKETINNILENLPNNEGQRQTLLFSATQTKSIKALARLSLNNPQYIAVHESSQYATPSGLQQLFNVVDIGRKLDVLWSFVKTHLRAKTIVFLSSCKQVKFIYEIFRRMRPGIPLLHLHGKMNQKKRMAIYYSFIERTETVMFATDIAARGLDFPSVDWVVQFDCPDSVASYIHRVGRTARYRSKGHAILFLLPSEVAMVKQLRERNVPLKKVKVNLEKMMETKAQCAGFLAQDNNLKYLGQKAFVSYVRSVHFQSDKIVFDSSYIQEHAGQLASSWGLPGTPRIKIKGDGKRRKTVKNMPYALRELLEEGKITTASQRAKQRKKNKVEKMLTRTNQTVFSEARSKLRADSSDDEGESFMKVKRKDHGLHATPDGNTDDTVAVAAVVDDNILTLEEASQLPLERRRRNRLLRGDKSEEETEDEDHSSSESDFGDDDTFEATLAHHREKKRRAMRKKITRGDREQLRDENFAQVFKQKINEEDLFDRKVDHVRVKRKHRKVRQYIRKQNRLKSQGAASDRPQGTVYVLGGSDEHSGGGGSDIEHDTVDSQDEDEQAEPPRKKHRKQPKMRPRDESNMSLEQRALQKLGM